jgi:hypothetical protein
MQTGQLGTVGIGSLVLVMFVIMGAVRYVFKVSRAALDFAENVPFNTALSPSCILLPTTSRSSS